MEVPVAHAKKSSWPSSATLISGAMYSYFIKYGGTNDNKTGYTLAPYDALKCSWKFREPSVTDTRMDCLI